MRHLTLAALTLLFFACDDSGGDGTDPADAGPSEDMGRTIGDVGGGGGEGGEGGAGGEAGMGGEGGEGGAGGEAGMGGEGGAGGEGPPCDPASMYGLLSFPEAVFGDEMPQFNPRAVWTGQEWGVLWQTPSDEAGVNDVMFQRVSSAGEALGSPALLGQAELPAHAVVFNGMGYVAAWKQARTAAGAENEGIRVRVLDTDGTPAQAFGEVPTTFDVQSLDLAWAPLAGGMLVFTRGRSGSGGLWATPVDNDGSLRATQPLSASTVSSPAVSFGDGAWGVAWLDRDSETPSDLVFVVINDGAQPVSNERRQENAGAQGNVHIAFGMGTFGVGWSKLDPMGTLKPFVTLLDSAGDVLATPPVTGPEGFGVVTGMSWLDPNAFGVSWQDNTAQRVRVGLTRVNTSGQVITPTPVPVEEGTRHTGLTMSGNVTIAGGFFTADPMADPAGGFSDAARVLHVRVGVCQ